MFNKPLSKLLDELLGELPHLQLISGDEATIITHITQDSRNIMAGGLFVAIKGELHNGEDYINEAIKRNASAILVAQDYDIADLRDINIAILTHPNPRLALSLIAEAFYQPQPTHKIAITGTDGKTSTAEFTRQLWELCGNNAISIGTLGLKSARIIDNLPTLSDNTSPEPARFYETLSECAKQNIQHVVVEASSIGIEQHRLAGFAPNVAIFTSFSQDHLDYHGTMEEYFQAKAALFTQLLPQNETAILCTDYAPVRQLAEKLRLQHKNVITYGDANIENCSKPDLSINSIELSAQGQIVNFNYQRQDFSIAAPLYGDFQAYNLLAASLAIATDLQLSLEDILQHWQHITPIKGRLQLVQKTIETNNKLIFVANLIFVDYAHTAGALEKALKTLRPYATNKLHILFGCGGDRDALKRPQMGLVAHNFADIITITDDNPRTENASAIRASIKATCPNAVEIACRAQAIKHAISQLTTGDVLLIAGKGHEDYQIIGTTKHPFDDAMEAQKYL